VDAVGAGDAYTAGMLSALAERDALTRTALLALDEAAWLAVTAFASATAAISCERPGADPPYAPDVRARLDETETTRSEMGGTS
jgi:fructokinase